MVHLVLQTTKRNSLVCKLLPNNSVNDAVKVARHETERSLLPTRDGLGALTAAWV
jgi:hypothetical protein